VKTRNGISRGGGGRGGDTPPTSPPLGGGLKQGRFKGCFKHTGCDSGRTRVNFGAHVVVATAGASNRVPEALTPPKRNWRGLGARTRTQRVRCFAHPIAVGGRSASAPSHLCFPCWYVTTPIPTPDTAAISVPAMPPHASRLALFKFIF
jgi:hypothetical protein